MSMPASAIFRGIGALGAGLAVGYQLFGALTNKSALLRPPGALSEADFKASCIRCGKCGLACPYRVVAFDRPESYGTPCIAPREGACHLCEDFPCITSCPTGALAPVKDRASVRMGVAVINRDLCVAFRGIRCEVCYRVCPFIDKAIEIKFSTREGDARHMIFEPVVNGEYCVGCGICEERCIIHDPMAVYIKPRDS